MSKKVKKEVVQEEVKSTPVVKAEVTTLTLWDRLKNVPISMYSLPPKPLHTLLSPVLCEEKQVICKLQNANGATALVGVLDQQLNVLSDGLGAEKRTDQFDLQVENGLLIIKQK